MIRGPSAASLLAEQTRELSRTDAQAEAIHALDRVRRASRLGQRYPADLSGGARQRVTIGRALTGHAGVLICDEMTFSLGVSVQAAGLELLEELRTALELSMLFITQDLGVVASTADTVLVLNKGEICERGPTAALLTGPADSYTPALVGAAPRLDPEVRDAALVVNRAATFANE